jgi:cytoskeletal protein RodZ
MDQLITLAILVLLFLFLGAVLGWIAFFRTQQLKKQIDTLTEEIRQSKTGTASSPAARQAEAAPRSAKEASITPKVDKTFVQRAEVETKVEAEKKNRSNLL